MKKLVISIFSLMLMVGGVNAQLEEANGPMRQRIEAMKVAFITDKLALSTEQAQQFWPVFNQFEADKKAIKQKYRSRKTIAQMSDVELEKRILDSYKQAEDVIEVDRQYYNEFKKVITIRQIALLKKAEQEFNKEVLKKVMTWQQQRNRRRQNGNN